MTCTQCTRSLRVKCSPGCIRPSSKTLKDRRKRCSPFHQHSSFSEFLENGRRASSVFPSRRGRGTSRSMSVPHSRRSEIYRQSNATETKTNFGKSETKHAYQPLRYYYTDDISKMWKLIERMRR